ncbi:MAG: efflux RND transporter periplasmic adaptor subunit [Burkholderiaceae bacterium]|nr:efflux RND transporter periplasmic adaptor subunit [Burkholderiaceae bacterium]
MAVRQPFAGPAGAALAVALVGSFLLATTLPGAQARAASSVSIAGETLEVAMVGVGATAQTYTADGRVEAVRETTIAAQVAGKVISLGARAGDRVRSGQELARIDARAAEHNEVALAAQLAGARAQSIAAQRELERTRQLVERGFLSPATLDKVEAEKRSADEAVRALEAQRAGAATQTGWHRIVAPFDGVVTTVTTELGDTAMPGKPLMQLYDPRRLRVAVDVPAAQVARLVPAAAAPLIEIPDAAPGARHPGATGVLVVPAADPVAHTQLVRLDLKGSPPGLHPGLFARVRFVLAAEPGAEGAGRLTVPTRALVERGDLRAVYVVGERSIALRQVRVGRTTGDSVEVLAGLSPGERVALDPVAAARLAPGVPG